MEMFIFLLFVQTACILSKIIYVTNERLCTTPCSGSTDDPIDNLWYGISMISNESIEFVLLKPQAGDHYLLYHEKNDTIDEYYIKTTIEINTSLTVRTLDCLYDYNIISSKNLWNRCYSPSEKGIIFLKSEEFRLVVTGNVTIFNIEFDGSESLAKYISSMEDPSVLTNCLSSRSSCLNLINSEEIQEPDVSSLNPSGAFVTILEGCLTIYNSTFRNLIYYNTSGLFKLLHPIKVNFRGVNFSHYFIKDGIISPFSASNNWETSNVSLDAIEISDLNFPSNPYVTQGLIQTPQSGVASLKISNLRVVNSVIKDQMFLVSISKAYLTELSSWSFENLRSEYGKNYVQFDQSNVIMKEISIFSSYFREPMHFFSFTSSSVKIDSLIVQNSIIFSIDYFSSYGFLEFALSSVDISNIYINNTALQKDIIPEDVAFLRLNYCRTKIKSFTINKSRSDGYSLLISRDDEFNLAELNLIDSIFESTVGFSYTLFKLDEDIIGCVLEKLYFLNNFFDKAVIFNLVGTMSINNLLFSSNHIINSNFLMQGLFHGDSIKSKKIIFQNLMISGNRVSSFSAFFYLIYQNVEFINVTYRNNSLTEFLAHGIFSKNSQILIDYNVIDANLVDQQNVMSHFFVIDSSPNLTMKNSNLSSNQIGTGYLIKNYLSNVFIQNTTFFNNSVYGSLSYQGLIYVGEKAIQTLENVSFIDTFLSSSGSLLNNDSPVNISFINVLVSKSRVSSSSPMITTKDSTVYFESVTFNDIIFADDSKSMLVEFSGSSGNVLIKNMSIVNSVVGPQSRLFLASNNYLAFHELFSTNNSFSSFDPLIQINFLQGSLVISGLDIENTTFLNQGSFLTAQTNNLSFHKITINNINLDKHNGAALFELDFIYGKIVNVKLMNLITRDVEPQKNIFYFENAGDDFNLSNLEVVDSIISANLTIISFESLGKINLRNMTIKRNFFGYSSALIICQSSLNDLGDFLYEKNIINSTILRFLPGRGILLKNFVYKENIFFDPILKRYSEITMENFNFFKNVFSKTMLIENQDSSDIILVNLTFEKVVLTQTLIFLNFISTKVSMKDIIFKDMTLNKEAILIKGTGDSTFLISDFSIENVTKPGISLERQKNKNSNYLLNFEFSEVRMENVSFSQTFLILNLLSSKAIISNMKVNNLSAFSGYRRILTISKGSVSINNISIHNFEMLTNLNENDRLFENFDGILTIENTFFNNFHSKQANIVFLYGGQLIIKASKFQNILIPNNFLIEGEKFDDIQIENSEFYNCSSTISAKNADSVTLTYTNLTFTNTSYQAVDLLNLRFFQSFSVRILYNTLDSACHSVISLSLITGSIYISDLEIGGALTYYGALYIKLAQKIKEMTFSFLYFYNNTAYSEGGGGLTISDTAQNTVKLEDSKFIFNSASGNAGGKGGAILLLNENFLTSSILFINKTVFENNHASKSGGAVFTSYSLPKIDNYSSFKSNKVSQLNNHIASSACSLKYFSNLQVEKFIYTEFIETPSPTSTSLTLTDVGGNIPLTSQNFLALVDCYNQIIQDDNTSILILKISINQTQRNYYYKSNQGKFTLSGLNIRNPSNSIISASLTTDGISISQAFVTFSSIDSASFSYNSIVKISFRPCSLGELFSESDGCTPCPYGHTHFSLEPNYNGSCEICHQASMNCRGGSDVGPNPGYWRLNKSSSIFAKCRNIEACEGALVEDDALNSSVCAYGYEGNLCDRCIEGFGKIRGRGICFECKNAPNGYLALIATILLIIAFIILFLRSMTINGKHQEIIVTTRTCILKIMIHHVQTLSLILTMQIEWPFSIRAFSEVFESLSLINMNFLGIECFYNSTSIYTGLDIPYLKMIMMNLMPIGFLALTILGWIVNEKIFLKRKENFQNLKKSFKFMLIFVGFYLFTPVINENIGIAFCQNLYREDNPIYYMQRDYDIQCFDEKHMTWTLFLSIPALIFWLILLPYYLFKKSRSQREHNKLDHLSNYCLLVEGYKSDCQYWEAIIMFRKLFIITINFLGSFKSINLQVYFANYVIIGSYLLQERVNPFKNKVLNELEVKSLACITLSSMGALYFNFITQQTFFEVIVVISIIGSNIAFCIILIKSYLKSKFFEEEKRNFSSL